MSDQHKTTDHAWARPDDPGDICARLRAVERDMGADSWPAGAAVVRDAAAEIGRLRVAIRVNALRQGATDAEIDEVLYGKR